MQTHRDENKIPVSLGISDADGSTLLEIQAEPTSHGLMVDDGASGNDLSGDNALRDDNRVVCLTAVSSTDGVTPVQLYINSATGKLLIQST